MSTRNDTPPQTKRRVDLVTIYAAERWNRAGTRSYPVGKHVRAEIRDRETGEVLAKHAYSPFSTQRLRNDSRSRGEVIVRVCWEVE